MLEPAHPCRAAMPRDAAQDRLADPEAVLQHLGQVETRPVVPHERLNELRSHLDIDRHWRCAVSGGIEQRLAQCPHQRGPPGIERAVTGHDQVNRYAVEVLHFVRNLGHSRGESGLRAERASVGPLMALLAMGLALASYGSLILAGNAFSWTGNLATIALAGSLAAIGLLSVVLGLAGWRAGFVAFLAVVLAIAAWTSTVVPAGIHVDGRVGDATWTPTSISSGANSGDYRLGVGNGVLDLSKLATQGLSTAANPATIPVSDQINRWGWVS